MRILLFNVADDGLPPIVHMDVLDADNLLTAVTQAAENLNLRCISPHQTSRSRTECRNSPFCGEGGVQLGENRHGGAVEWQAFSLDGAWSRRDS